MNVATFEPGGGKKMGRGKPYETNDRANKPGENNNCLQAELVPLGAAKRPRMSNGVNSATNGVNNSTNATRKMKSGGKNGSTFGWVYPTWA